MLKRNDALRDDVAAGRRRLHIKSSLSVSKREKLPPPPAWIMQPPDQTLLNGLFHPERRLITMQKQLKNSEVY